MTIYSIIDRPSWNNGIWNEVVQDYDTARRSLDGTKVVIKWTAGETPSRLPEGAPLYYHPNDPPDDLTGYEGSILDAMDGPEWTATPG